MFCGKCGARLPDNANFCGKCGSKVLTNNKSNSLNSFIDNITPTSPSTDKDIFDQIEESNKENSKVKLASKSKNQKKSKKNIKFEIKPLISKIKSNTKSKSKSKSKSKKGKPKLKIKPKAKINAKSKRPTKKSIKINRKILVVIIVILLAIISGITAYLIKFSDKLFADKYVESAIRSTYKYIDNNKKNYDSMPSIICKNHNDDKYTKDEALLSIKNAKGGLISEDVLGNLKGISIKTDSLNDSENNINLTKIILSNKNKDDITGELYSTPNIAVFDIPRLYEQKFGINLIQEESTINSSYYTKLKDYAEIISQFSNSSVNVEDSIILSSKKLVKNIATNSKFSLVSKDEETNARVYNTTINNKVCLDELKNYLTEIKSDENVVKMFSYMIFTTNNNSLEKSKNSFTGKIDDFIGIIDKAIEDNSVSDIVLTLKINDDKIIENVEFNTIIGNLKADVCIDIIDGENKVNYKLKVKLSYAEEKDSFISLDLNTMYDNTYEDIYSVKTSVIFDNSVEEKIYLDISSEFNKIKSNYSFDFDFHTDTSYENFACKYIIDGKYENTDNVEKLDINSMNLNLSTDLYRFNFEFTGYISHQKCESIEEKSIDNIIYVDKLSDDEIVDMKKEIYKNACDFLDMFEKYEW